MSDSFALKVSEIFALEMEDTGLSRSGSNRALASKAASVFSLSIFNTSSIFNDFFTLSFLPISRFFSLAVHIPDPGSFDGQMRTAVTPTSAELL